MEKSEVPSEEKKKISKASLAQPAERTAVNREVTGSIPVRSAFCKLEVHYQSPSYPRDVNFHMQPLSYVSDIQDFAFTWTQSMEEILVSIYIGTCTPTKNVTIDFTCKEITIRLSNLHIQEELDNLISYRECMWYFDDVVTGESARVIRLVLIKAKPSIVWSKVFLNQSVSLSESEMNQIKKAILLERFAVENPNFDFSEAEFIGECFPDARSFLGGLTL